MQPLLIPYLAPRVYQLGPVPVDPWATLVALGFIVGLEVARARGIRLGLDTRDVVDGAVATVGCGFVGGHLVHVLAYHPELLREKGWVELLYVWAGLSSYGGFLGAVLGSLLFYKVLRRRSWWAHADAVMFGFPFGWTLGRLGCFMAHDHIGRPTTFPLAVDFPGGPRHDLGLDEALWTAVIALVFWRLGRRKRPAGFFVALWCILYAPARFLLDFLRNTDLSNADVRWWGLTPAQYGSIALVLAGVAILVRSRKAAAPSC